MNENDYYESDSGGMSDSKPMDESKGEDKESGKTFLVNSEICPGMKPGEEMIVTIERVLEGEYQISYAPKKSDSSESEDSDMAMSEHSSDDGGMFD